MANELEKYSNKLLFLKDDFNVDYSAEFFLLDDDISSLSKYYYKKMIGGRRNPFPSVNRLLRDEVFYDELDGMDVSSVFVNSGNLMRRMIMEKGLIGNEDYFDIIPIITERLVYYDLSFKFSDSNIKWNAMAYQVNRAKKAANFLNSVEENSSDVRVRRKVNFSRMVLISTALASTIDTRKINSDFSKRINKIILGKESIDDFVLDLGGVYNNPKINMALSYQINALKLHP